MFKIMQWVRIQQPETDIHRATEIALTEALNNIVEHGFAQKNPQDIHVDIETNNQGIKVNITDYGAPYPDGQIPNTQAPILPVKRQDLPEGGFGWMLIREVTSAIHYARKNDKNCLCLYFDVLDHHSKSDDCL